MYRFICTKYNLTRLYLLKLTSSIHSSIFRKIRKYIWPKMYSRNNYPSSQWLKRNNANQSISIISFLSFDVNLCVPTCVCVCVSVCPQEESRFGQLWRNCQCRRQRINCLVDKLSASEHALLCCKEIAMPEPWLMNCSLWQWLMEVIHRMHVKLFQRWKHRIWFTTHMTLRYWAM